MKKKKISEHYLKSKGLHLNYSIISDLIEKNAKVLDLGCGSGELLKLLKEKKNISGRGIEIDQDNVISCIEKGISVFQGDLDEGLAEYEEKAYDYVVLSQTLQWTKKPDYVIDEMLRVGKKGVISFPNFAYWRVRCQLFFGGFMPKSKMLPFEWFNTPNIHLLTINDFRKFCKERNIKIIDESYTTRACVRNGFFHKLLSNIFAEEVIFIVTR
ncbi:MAG: methionine biosynthesis protein MetW [bacterium]